MLIQVMNKAIYFFILLFILEYFQMNLDIFIWVLIIF